MQDLKKFFDHLMRALEARWQRDREGFVSRFNNEPSRKTARNRTPRTDLMLGMPSNRGAGVVATALCNFLKSDGGTIECDTFEYERYIDIIVPEGDWWAGKKIYQGITEVENDINEFKGTVSDHLRLQAKWKHVTR